MIDQIDRYKVVIWWAEEYGHFLGEIPDLPGCMADGASQEEVLTNIRVIAKEWIEFSRDIGNPIPEPRPVRWPVDDPVDDPVPAKQVAA